MYYEMVLFLINVGLPTESVRLKIQLAHKIIWLMILDWILVEFLYNR